MSEDLAADLAVRLRDAHRLLRGLALPESEKRLLAGRLVALSDTAKVDLASASRRLDRLLADLEPGQGRDPEAP